MYKIFCKSKIQNLKVDNIDLNLPSPILLNKNLLKDADILDGERVQVLNLSTGDRIFVYIKPSTSNKVIIGRPLSRWIKENDKIVILSYILMKSSEKLKHKLKVIDLNKG